MVNMIDVDFLICLRVTNAGLNLHQLTTGDNSEVYKAYKGSGGLHMESPRDTHYLMDGGNIIFIGNRDELLGFTDTLV